MKNIKKPLIINLLTKSETKKLNKKFKNTLLKIKNLHLPNLSLDDFKRKFVNHEATIMKCVAYNIMNDNFWGHIKNKVSQKLKKENICHEELFCHPIFYSRHSSPDIQNQNKCLLEGQPHYDRSYNIKAFTIWLTLDRANSESGGLCFFKENKFIKKNFLIKWGEKNKFNTDKYVKNYKKLDKNLEKVCIKPNLKPGQCYIFDSNTLHGSIKSISRERWSLDFRFIPKSMLKKCDYNSKKIIETFNNDINLSNAKNLMLLGGKKLLNKKYYLNKIQPLYDLKFPSKLSWRDEYSWIN